MTPARTRRGPRFEYLTDAAPRGRNVDPHAGPAIAFAWRLVAANNRPVGRAWARSVSLDACVAEATRVHDDVNELGTTVFLDRSRSAWHWRSTPAGATGVATAVLAVSPHPYARRVECVRALAQFLAAAHEADPAHGVVRHFGPRSLREYAAADEPANTES